MEKQSDYNQPRDKKNFVYIIFYWLGIGTLLPWNFFISVSDYWKHKWATVVVYDSDDIINGTIANVTDASVALNELQTKWGPNLAVCAMVPNVTILILNAVFGHRFKTQPRLLVSLCMVIVFFAFTAAMVMVDTSAWQDTFYIVTLLSVVLINIFAAIFQSGLLGIAGKFPPKYMGAVFSGQALGGIFASAMNVIFLACGADQTFAALLCFIMAVVFLATALVGYIFVTKMEFFQFFVNEDDNAKIVSKPEEAQALEGGKPSDDKLSYVGNTKVNPLLVLKQIVFYAISVFILFGVTLGCFPAITASVMSTNAGSGSLWTDKFFTPVSCFLLFNVGDYIGRFAAEMLKFPGNSKLGITSIFSLSLARIVFIPLFVFCNANPYNRQLTSVVFANDYVYILFMAVFSVTNGYLSCISMMNAPQLLKRPEEQQTAASLMVAFLGLGLGVGSALSNVFVELI